MQHVVYNKLKTENDAHVQSKCLLIGDTI